MGLEDASGMAMLTRRVLRAQHLTACAVVKAEANRKTHNPDFSLLSTRIQTHLAHEHLTLEATSFFF